MCIRDSNNQTLSLNANSEGRATFQVVADPAIAVGKISVAVNGLGEKFTDETEISIRPPSALQKMSGSGSVTGGSTQQVTINTVSYTHLRAHETGRNLVCRLL